MEGHSRGAVCGRIECVKVFLCLADRWGFERIEFSDWSIVPRIHPKWLEDVQLGAPPFHTRLGQDDGILHKLLQRRCFTQTQSFAQALASITILCGRGVPEEINFGSSPGPMPKPNQI